MNEQEIILRFFQVVAFDLRHLNYAHTVKKAALYNQLVAGVGLDKLLKKFVRRETEALFDQRVALTQHIVTSICKNLLDIFYKVPRSNSARRVLTYEGSSPDEKVTFLENILKGFWGTESWDDFMATRYIELNAQDPNSFVVFEWDKFDGKKEAIQPRPFEVSSSEAIDYKTKNNVLQYLIVQNKHFFPKFETINDSVQPEFRNPKDTITEGKKYTLYLPTRTIQLLEIDEKSITPVNPGDVAQAKVFKTNGKSYIKLSQKYYEFIAFKPHNVGSVPAFRVGYLRDPATKGETCVNPLHAVEPYLLKSIKVNSELDLVAALLAFPQVIKYGKDCVDTQCYEGYYANGDECKTCHGSGMKPTANSAQDSITIRMPKSKEEMIPLSEYMKYLSPEVAIVKWQEEYVDKITTKCQTIMYNSDTFTRSQVAETATGKNLDMQNVYDTLHPFATTEGKIWTFGCRIIAALADRAKGLVCSKTYGKDFKLKSLDTLIFDLTQASKIGNGALVRHINDDIAQIIFSEKPIELQRYNVQQMYNPFAGKGEKEIMQLMSSDFVRLEEKILHANIGRIFDELELKFGSEKTNFYQLNRSKQRKAIYEMVAVIMSELEAQKPDPELLLE